MAFCRRYLLNVFLLGISKKIIKLFLKPNYLVITVQRARASVSDGKIVIILTVDAVKSSRLAIYTHGVRSREMAALIKGGTFSHSKILSASFLSASMSCDICHSIISVRHVTILRDKKQCFFEFFEISKSLSSFRNEISFLNFKF
jgi:hypothetical protein